MAATMPPTTHALPHDERLRLMRSTRKLGAVLGETPLLVDPPPSPSRQGHARSNSTMTHDGRRTGRLHMASASLPRSASLRRASSTVRTHSYGPATLAPRPLLVIDLPTDSTPAEVMSAGSPPPSPLTPTSANLPTAMDEDAARRRKLAKVVRTLGENVPPALVFPTTTTSTARRRASTLSVPESVRECLRAHAPAPAVPAPIPEGRASSDTFTSAHTHVSTSSFGTRLSRESQEYLLPPARAPADMMRRQELGWSGEWGGAVQSMDDVVRGLRGMKLK